MGCVHIIAFALTATLASQSGILSGTILNYKIRIESHERVLTKSWRKFNYQFYCSVKDNKILNISMNCGTSCKLKIFLIN